MKACPLRMIAQAELVEHDSRHKKAEEAIQTNCECIGEKCAWYIPDLGSSEADKRGCAILVIAKKSK